jgi:hypothetical protein
MYCIFLPNNVGNSKLKYQITIEVIISQYAFQILQGEILFNLLIVPYTHNHHD